MELGSVIYDARRRAAILVEDRVLVTDIPGLDAAISAGVDLGPEMNGRWLAREAAVFDAPLRPPVVFCAGQNYRDHLAEKAPVDVREPEFFLKAGQTVASPSEPCRLDPHVTGKLDYETELGVVIGKKARNVSPEDALQYVFGYTVVNDLTARDRQVVARGNGDFNFALGPGKNFDGATRLSGSVVPASEIGNPQSLLLTTRVRGELRQSNTTAAMTFDVAHIVAFMSRLLTLWPGTVIATGTPGGTGWGQDRELGGTGVVPAGCVPACYLAEGDDVDSTIERVGRLTFNVVA